MLHLLDRTLAAVSVAAASLVIVLLFAGPALIGAKRATGATAGSGASGASSTSGTSGATGTTSTKQSGSPAGQTSGSTVFTSAGCSGCHTLKAAGATGTVGPNLDQLQPSAATVSGIVRSGAGAMPSFSGKLSDAQIAAVATYVSSVAGH